MGVPAGLSYTKEHEWVRRDDELAVVGITEHAQEQLGDVVFVDLPEVGDSLEVGSVFGTVESVKAVSDLFAPINGEVVEVNGALEDAPDTVNADPYGGGWMIKVKPAADEGAELMSATDYDAIVD